MLSSNSDATRRIRDARLVSQLAAPLAEGMDENFWAPFESPQPVAPAIEIASAAAVAHATPLDDSKTVTVALHSGQVVRIHEVKDSAWEGGNIWPPAHALVDILLAGEAIPNLDGRTVLECGAGCGLVGIAAALLGARRVVLTDLPTALPTLRLNAILNDLTVSDGSTDEPPAKACSDDDEADGEDEDRNIDPYARMEEDRFRMHMQARAEARTVEVAALDWYDPIQPLLGSGRTFDLVIASECLYDPCMVRLRPHPYSAPRRCPSLSHTVHPAAALASPIQCTPPLP